MTKTKSDKGADRKDYVINLRVSRETYDKLKEKAAENRDTLSGLLRKVIEDGGEVLQDLSEDIFGDRKKRKLEDVVGYQDIVMAKDMKCFDCGSNLKKDSKAVIGAVPSGKDIYLCVDCASKA